MPTDKTNDPGVRAACLNCIDGRTQLPVLRWIQENYGVDFVDVITAAGMDGVLARQDDIAEILRTLDISVSKNGSSRIFVVGHYDCKGNPADKKSHRQDILKAVARLKTLRPALEIIGLWVDDHWRPEVVHP